MAIVARGPVGVRSSADAPDRVRRGAGPACDLCDRQRDQLLSPGRSSSRCWAGGSAGRRSIVLGHVRRYENYLVAAIVLVLVIVFWLMRKRHVEDEVVEVLATGDTGRSRRSRVPDDVELNTGRK